MGRHWIVLHNLLIRYKWWSMSYSKIVQQKNTSDTWASISQISRTQILRWNPDALGIPTFSPAGRSSRINFSMDRWRNRLEHLSPNSLSIRHSPFKKRAGFHKWTWWRSSHWGAARFFCCIRKRWSLRCFDCLSQPCTVHINYNRVGGLSVYMWIIYVIMINYIYMQMYIYI
jgi:hypothetical protein